MGRQTSVRGSYSSGIEANVPIEVSPDITSALPSGSVVEVG